MAALLCLLQIKTHIRQLARLSEKIFKIALVDFQHTV